MEMEKRPSLSLLLQGKALFFPSYVFIPGVSLFLLTKHFTPDTSVHQMCGGFFSP